MKILSMKPFQLILLVVFGGLAILGLILFATFKGFGGNTTQVGAVTIWGTLPAAQVTPVIDTLKNADQSYSGVQYFEKSEATFDASLAEALASGSGPDLILISQEELLAEQNKLSVIPSSVISERTYIDTYLPIDELFLAANGTYGLPFAVDPLVLYFNRSTLSQAGIATPPTTWEAVTGLAQQLSAASGGTVNRSLIPFGAYGNVGNARAIVSLLLLQAGNPISAVSSNGPEGHLADAGANNSAVTPAQSALGFYTQFADPVKTVYTWNSALPNARQQFLAGNLAFYPGFASELAALKAANPNLDFDMAPIPQPQTSSQKTTYGLAYAFAIPKASKNPSGALTAAEALAAPAESIAVASSLGMAPAIRTSLVPNGTDPYQPVYFPQALIAKGWLSPSPATTDQILSTMIGNITSGRLSISEALTEANEALTAAL